MRKKLTIGLVGFGVVGSGLYQVLNQSHLMDARIKRIVVKNKDKKRSLDASYFSYDIKEILSDHEINVVVELIDDAKAAFEIVTKAIANGKHVVTANKKMLAENLDFLIDYARKYNVSLLYEASVGGSIPIIRNLEEYYNNDSLSGIQGIVNGTTNYILSQTNRGKDYQTALKEAQDLGFAESDPTLDVDGFDSKFKLILLIKHAFGLSLQPDEVFHYGIRHIKPADVRFASEKGYRIKLFAHAERIGSKIVGFVAPHLIEKDHVAYNVNNEFNAVTAQALFSDRQLFQGKGAGSFPTASAVLSDISALQFDYRYEYKKEHQAENIQWGSSFLAKVYAGSSKQSSLESLPWIKKEDIFQSLAYHYIIGWVDLSELVKIPFNDREDLFFAFLPEPMREVEPTNYPKGVSFSVLEN